MPLNIDGRPMQMPHGSSVEQFIHSYPQFIIESRQLGAISPISIDPNEAYLFVHQMETSVLSADDPTIKMLGVDDVTTCCCAIIRHTGSLATGVGHFDGNDTREGLNRMLIHVKDLTLRWAQANNLSQNDLDTHYQYDVYLIGGFEDSRRISIDVCSQLLENLSECTLDLNLKMACIYTNNTYWQDNMAYPTITGLIINVKSGCILPASFSFQGPLEEIRRLRFATKPPIIMHSVYNPFSRILEIKPYDWTLANDTIQQLLGLNTSSFLHYWSTSPLAEKPSFVPACKSALKFLKDNRQSLFCSGTQSYRFMRTDKEWRLVE